VINADKAVVASLIEPPPPSSIGDAPAFDLSRWDGDPNDPALDPLFFAVDRMVNAARAGVAASAQPDDFEEAPPRTQARRAPAAPPSTARALGPQSEALGSEAEHWRSIRDSRDPADFMDYLARYGPDGAFSEVAELRLKQLTGNGGAATRPAARSAPPRPATRRVEPPAPPRRSESPVRMPDPPSRREAAAAVRRPNIERGGLDRGFDRSELREPPKGEGGALRTFVLIALLGGAALAGGLYFGGMGDVGASTSPDVENVAPMAPPPSTGDAGYQDLEEPPSVPLSTAVDERPSRTPPRTERTDRADRPGQTAGRTERTPPASEESTRAYEPPAQPQVLASNTATGGPISLSPGSQTAPSTTPGTVVPLSPPTTTPSTPAATTPRSPPEELRGPMGSVVWTQRPSARRISDLYPQRALRQGLGGRVQLDCRVNADLSLSCRIASETPAGEGFGRAALAAADAYRARSTLSDGTSAVGTSTRLAVNFQAPQR
jgi:protein TonB